MLPRMVFIARIVCLRVALALWLAGAGPVGSQGALLNELVVSNGRTVFDENGDSPDWIELFNPGSNAVDLAGWGLSDSVLQPFKWTFTNAPLAARGFLLVFASNKDRQPVSVAAAAPTSFSGLKLWLRADAVNTSDTTQVRAAAGSFFVKSWRDQSGFNNHAVQGADASQPLHVAASAAFAGRPALRFDGSNDVLNLAGYLAANNFTLIAVARANVSHQVDEPSAVSVDGVAGQRYLFGALHGGDYQAGAGLSLGTNGATVYEHGSGYMPPLAVAGVPLPGVAIVSVSYAARRPSLFVQGNLASTGFTSARTNVNPPVEIGAGAYGAFSGDLAEVLLFNRTLSDTERGAVESWLAARYGIVLPRYYHTNFKLQSGGERVVLTQPDGTTADDWPSVDIPRDVSFGRAPDGGSNRVWFAQPTPGAPNTTPPATELLQKPQFSIERGFYTTNLSLVLTATNPGAQIRFTLDGSEPTSASSLYATPIPIISRAGQPNVVSAINTGGGWQPPAGEVFKITVVRAGVFKAGAIPSETKTHSYVIAPTTNRYSLPVISLATDRDGFFGPTNGIYIGQNAFNRGDDWTRRCHFEFFEKDGRIPSIHDCGVKIHGNTSRGFPIKALDLIADWQSEGDFMHRFFTNRTRRDWNHLLLRQSGHDYFYTYFRDALMSGLVEDLGADAMAYRPVVLFINGEYWGLHNLREKEDESFIADHGGPGVTRTNIDYLEGYAAPIAGDVLHYSAMIDYLATRDLRLASNYAHLQEQMQTDNYTDYKVAEIFTYRWDIGNHRLWRPRTPDGRWRWLQFDNDVGWGGFWAVAPAWEFNFLAYDTEPNGPWTQYQQNPGGNDHNNPTTTFLLRKLLENDSFKHGFINRFADLLNTSYSPSNTIARINSLAAGLAVEIPEHTARWRQPDSFASWSNNVQYLRTYASLRPQFCRQHLTNKFLLPGQVNVTLRVNNTNAGAIRFSTLTLAPPTNAPWTGVYFRGVPLTVSALPAPGWRFTNWTGLAGPPATNSTVTYQTLGTAGLTLTANFISVPDTNPPVPAPHDLALGPYIFTSWTTNEWAGTYPPNMIFHQTATNAAADPALAVEFSTPWTLPYDRASRSRVTALGEDGVAFLNTSDPQADGGGYLGAAVLALRTTGRTNIQVAWRGGTVTPNARFYALRLQYRTGPTNAWNDLLNGAAQPVEYPRHAAAGHSAVLGPFTLPAACADQPYVQLRWKYHHVSGVSGPRDQLRLDDIVVADRITAPGPGGISPQAGGGFLLNFPATPNLPCTVETSTNLLDWLPLGGAVASGEGVLQFSASPAPHDPARYFRVRWP